MPGVGKSVVIQQFLNTAGRCTRIWEFLFIAYMPHMQAGELFATASANFSAQTSTANVGVLKDEGQSKTKRKCHLAKPRLWTNLRTGSSGSARRCWALLRAPRCASLSIVHWMPLLL